MEQYVNRAFWRVMMADISIKGFSPKSSAGEEFYLHTTDWWMDILYLFDDLVPEDQEIDEYFVRECMFCPITPWVEEEEAKKLAEVIDKYLNDEVVRDYLLDKYSIDPLYVDYFDNDEEMMQESINERLEQLKDFSSFLKESGGCRANWYGME